MQAGHGTVTRVDNLPFNYVTHAMEVAEEHGFDAWPHLQSTGLAEAVRKGTGAEVSRANYFEFIQLILENNDIPAFGVQLGRKFIAADYGVLGYAYASSSTTGDAMRTFLRYQQIAGSDGFFREELRVENGNGIIKVCSGLGNKDLYRFEIEESVGQWSVGGADSAGTGKPFFSRIHFTFPRPDYAGFMEELLQCPLYFSQSANELFFPEEQLERRSVMAEEVTAQLCEQQCEKLLQNVKSEGGLVEQVKRAIINRPGEVVLPEEVAGQLNLSYRSLRRRLSEEGTSFKEIQGEIRMGLAKEYLRDTHLSTQEIAFLLGYSEVTNFHRAFKKQAGQTPGAYREEARAR